MNVSTNKTVSDALLAAPFQLNIWLGSLILIAGDMSAIGSILVFSSRSFRKRACTIYLLAEAFLLIILFNFVLLTRMLQKGFRIPILDRYDVLCRMRYCASQYLTLAPMSLFVLASLDRLLSTHRSKAIRQWSDRTGLAYKLVLTCAIVSFLVSGHRLVLYSTRTGRCAARPGLYATIDNYIEAVISGFSPPIIVFVLSYLLLRSVRNTIQRQTAPTGPDHSKPTGNALFLRKTDRQLTHMLLWQTFVAIPAFLPYAIELVYTNVTEKWSKSAEWLAWESVYVEGARLMSYTFFSTRLYVTLLSSEGIRKQILQVLPQTNKVDVPQQTANTPYVIATAGPV